MIVGSCSRLPSIHLPFEKFRHKGVELNVLAAHLKSGEGRKEEQQRVDTLRMLFEIYDRRKSREETAVF